MSDPLAGKIRDFKKNPLTDADVKRLEEIAAKQPQPTEMERLFAEAERRQGIARILKMEITI